MVPLLQVMHSAFTLGSSIDSSLHYSLSKWHNFWLLMPVERKLFEPASSVGFNAQLHTSISHKCKTQAIGSHGCDFSQATGPEMYQTAGT